MGKPTRKGVQNRLENHFEENNYPWFAVKASSGFHRGLSWPGTIHCK